MPPTRFSVRFLLGVLTILACLSVIYRQHKELTTLRSEIVHLRDDRLTDMRVLMAQRVALDSGERTVETAVREISDQCGVPVTIPAEIDATKKIDIASMFVSGKSALGLILSEAGLSYKITPTGVEILSEQLTIPEELKPFVIPIATTPQ